jgi:hypothetical protein
LKFFTCSQFHIIIKEMVVERDKIESQIITLTSKIAPREKTT